MPVTSGMPSEARGTASPVTSRSGKPLEQLAEDDRHLTPGQVGAQTEVRTGPAEAHVRVGLAEHVEALRVVEDPRVTVGGAVEHHELVALVEVLAGQRHVAGRRAPHERDRRRRPNDLFDRAVRDTVDVGLPDRPLIRVQRQQVHTVADRGARRVVAGDRQQHEERRDLRRREQVFRQVVVHELRGQVVRRVRRDAPRSAHPSVC